MKSSSVNRFHTVEFIMLVLSVGLNIVLGISLEEKSRLSTRQQHHLFDLFNERKSRGAGESHDLESKIATSILIEPFSSNHYDLSPLTNDTETMSGEIRKKRQEQRQGRSDARTFVDFDIGPGVGVGSSPLCFEREVSGTCRYRSSPDECFRHEWTAYATIVNIGYKKITSIPEGLIVYPGGHARVRVFLKSSCCNPIVQFIATDLFLQSTSCLVDVRELQDLHPGEIVGIVIGCLLFVILVIVVIALCLRRQRRKKLEKDTVIFGRSLTRSKSGTGT